MSRAIQMTMFHVCNYGAALQTYAMQHFIDSIPGWKCETLNLEPRWNSRWTFEPIVDEGNPRRSRRPFWVRLMHAPFSVRNRLRHFFWSRNCDRPWREMFAKFRAEEIHLTRQYDSRASLLAAPPSADLYITGSDQTFNPRFTGGEKTWFWDFLTPEQTARARKISYASSFGMGKLPVEHENAYRYGLSGYHALSVRESGGAAIVRRLGLSAQHCCDPTILLTKAEWTGFAAKGRRKIRKPYILSYNLRYAVDPVPYNETIERQVSEKLKMPIVHLYERTMDNFTCTGCIVRDADLYDFVGLFLNASFVLTSSFHGVAFSMICEKPFIVYVNANHSKDCRAYDLLEKCGAISHAMEIPMTGVTNIDDIGRYKCKPSELEAFARFRDESAQWLTEQMRRALVVS